MRRPQARVNVRRQVDDVGQRQEERPLSRHRGAQPRQDRRHGLGGQVVLAQVLRARRQHLALAGLARARQDARARRAARGRDQHLRRRTHQRIHAETPRRRIQVAQALEQETLVESVGAPHRHIARHDGLVGGTIAQALRHRSHGVSPLSPRHRPVPKRQGFRHARGGPRLGQGFVNSRQRIRGVPDARRDRPAGPGLVDESQRGHEGDRAGGGAEREGRKKNGGRCAVGGRGRGGLPRAAHVGDRTRGRGLERERPSQADHLAALTQPGGAAGVGKQGRQ